MPHSRAGKRGFHARVPRADDDDIVVLRVGVLHNWLASFHSEQARCCLSLRDAHAHFITRAAIRQRTHALHTRKHGFSRFVARVVRMRRKYDILLQSSFRSKWLVHFGDAEQRGTHP
ncbi:hypothetical protein SDC9_103662 [bioreactor metagenome]|uniref:Uncharacterized protein n=1 Tax=bioreactor metagenome TaxID=1076179 RepID=A0A645AVM4_9ZZZZ